MVTKVGTRMDVSTRTDERTDDNFWASKFWMDKWIFLIYLSMDFDTSTTLHADSY